MVRPDQKGNFCPWFQHLFDDAFVRLSGVFPEGLERKHLPEAFDDGRFAGPAPPTRTLRLVLKCILAPSRKPPSQAIPKFGVRPRVGGRCSTGFVSSHQGRPGAGPRPKFRHLDEAGRAGFPQGFGVIHILCVDDRHRPARRCWASVFSTISRKPGGTTPTGPGKAQARRSSACQTLMRGCPCSVVSRPPFPATWAAIQIPPQLRAHSNNSWQSLLPVGESPSSLWMPHSPMNRS